MTPFCSFCPFFAALGPGSAGTENGDILVENGTFRRVSDTVLAELPGLPGPEWAGEKF